MRAAGLSSAAATSRPKGLARATGNSSSISRAWRLRPRLPSRLLAVPDPHDQPSRSNEAAQPQQQQPAAEDAAAPAGSQQAADPAAAAAAEAAVLAATAAANQTGGEADEESLLPLSLQAAPGGRSYLVMAAALSAAGLLIGLYAAPIAAACLKLGSSAAVQTQAAALVGCCGAALLRAASLAFFLAEGFTLGEGFTWRYQRINLGLAAAAAAAALLQPLSWAAAQPALLTTLLLAAGGVAAACAATFVQQWRGAGVFFASAAGYGDWEEALKAAGVYLLRDVTCLAGLVLLVLGAAAAVCGLQAAAGPAPAGGLPWASGAAAAAAAGESALLYLRRLLGLGALLTALQCVALAECASTTARLVKREIAIKLLLVQQQEQRDLQHGRLLAPLHVSPRRFDLLHLGFFAAAVMQGLWLAQAGGVAGAGAVPGVLNVNGGDPLWPMLYWSVLGSAVYFVARVACIDYLVVWGWLLGVLNYLAGWVSWFGVILFVDWSWITDVRRR